MPELPERSADVAGRSGSRRAGPIVAFLVVAIAALIVLAFATGDRRGARDPSVAATAPAASTLLEGETAARIERNAREADMLVDDSLQRRVARLQGVPVVVNQWASWCPPCRSEFPFFAELAQRHDRRVAFLGLNSRDDRGQAEAFLREHPVGYPSIFDEDAGQARSIGAGTGWPTTVFFDASGDAVLIRRGAYLDAEQLQADVDRYLLGTG